MKRKAWAKFACVTLALAMAAGCGKGDSEKIASPAPAQKTDDKLNSGNPLNLKLYNWGVLSDEEYEQLLMKPLSQKYPNVKLEMIMRDSNMKPENIAVSGLDLDIYAIQSGQVSEFVTYDLLEDVTPFLAKHKMSLDKFKPQYIDLVRGKTKDSIMGIPFGAGGSTPWALVYNKDIFDKFAVPYPKDGMMWDDVYELAKKLTRLDNGVQYKGLDFQNVVSLGSPLGAFSVDPKTEKSSMNTPEWAKAFALGKKINDIPGNDLPTVTAAKTRERFIKDKNVAMFASPALLTFIKEASSVKDLNWDVVQYPSYPEKPNISGAEGGIRPLLSIGSKSKYKDDVLKILDFLTSDEIQLTYSRMGGLSTLKNPEMEKNFSADVPNISSKNIVGVFKSKKGPYKPVSDYDNNADNAVNKKFDEVRKGKDVNTAIREIDEEINKQIEAAKKK